MGCDIHLHQEVLIDGEWHHYSCPRVSRNYLLFSKMAGVRGSREDAIASPRGVPADITTVTKMDLDSWGGDGHSHSWLASEEVIELCKWARELHAEDRLSHLFECILDFGFCFGGYWSGFHDEDFRGEVPGLQDFRFVFWFDN